MLIRVAIVGENSTLSNKLANQLIAFSMNKLLTNKDGTAKDGTNADERKRKLDVEVDIGFYPTVELLLKAYRNLDIAFLPYFVLEKGMACLHELFRCNRDCIAIPIGEPSGLICRYLAIRPGGHLRSCDDGKTLYALYGSCVKDAAASMQVLRFSTRNGAHAVNISEITYCQSNQKYVQIETISGTSYRKIGKLDAFENIIAGFWRIHQSYLVNPAFVIGMEKHETGWELRLVDGCRLPVSRAYRKETKDRFQNCPVDGQI